MDPLRHTHATLPPSPASSLRSLLFASHPPSSSSSSSSLPLPLNLSSNSTKDVSMLPPSPPISPDVPTHSQSSSSDLLSAAVVMGGLGLAPKEEEEEDFLSNDWSPPNIDSLDINDRGMMNEFMMMGCSKAACAMASEVVGIIIPALPKRLGYPAWKRMEAALAQEKKVTRTLSQLVSLAPHPLCVLVSSVILLERLASLYPSMGSGSAFKDTPCRVVFAVFLLSLKMTSDISHCNASFVRFTRWELYDINRMEREMLHYLKWDIYISPDELLHRATGFWTSHLATLTRLQGADDGIGIPLDIVGNLFLMKTRDGIDERSWRGGLVDAPGEGGRRIPDFVPPSSPFDLEPSFVEEERAESKKLNDEENVGPLGYGVKMRRSRACSGSVLVGGGIGTGLGGENNGGESGFGGLARRDGGQPTIWRLGRLERRGSSGNEEGKVRTVVGGGGVKMERRPTI